MYNLQKHLNNTHLHTRNDWFLKKKVLIIIYVNGHHVRRTTVHAIFKQKKNVLFCGFSMKSFVMIIDYCTVITVLIIIGKK